jgi:hypothetical protein
MHTKHTPGPWIVTGNFIDCDTPPCRIAVALASPEMEANARLIAAAPELLEALKACEPWCNDNRAVVMAREAIAKAEGTK